MVRSPRLLALLSDERLVREVRDGNETAFEVIYDRHSAGLLSFCRHLLGSQAEAEDAVQQTFVSAYTGLLADGREVHLKPWLFTIARNRCLSMIRARRPEGDADPEPSVAGLDQQVAQRGELRDLLRDLQRLPVSQRAALILSELRGFSHRDIGEVLECPPEKVKSLVFQARTHLVEYREARDTSCFEIRRELAARRRGAPSRRVREHIAACAECRRFRRELRTQRAKLAAIIPVMPAAALRARILAAVGGGSGGAGGGLVASLSGLKAVLLAAGSAGLILTIGATVTEHPGGATAEPSPPGLQTAQVPALRALDGWVSVADRTAHHQRKASHRHHGGGTAHRRAGTDGSLVEHGTTVAGPRRRLRRGHTVSSTETTTAPAPRPAHDHSNVSGPGPADVEHESGNDETEFDGDGRHHPHHQRGNPPPPPPPGESQQHDGGSGGGDGHHGD